MRYGPPFRYTRRPDGRRVAYQVVGNGALDLVFLFGFPSHLGLMWENPTRWTTSGPSWPRSGRSGPPCSAATSAAGWPCCWPRPTPTRCRRWSPSGSHPATLRDDDYPWGSTVEDHEALLAMIRASSTPEDAVRFLDVAAPREAADPSVRQWWRTFYLSAPTPAETHAGIRSLGPAGPRGVSG